MHVTKTSLCEPSKDPNDPQGEWRESDLNASSAHKKHYFVCLFIILMTVSKYQFYCSVAFSFSKICNNWDLFSCTNASRKIHFLILLFKLFTATLCITPGVVMYVLVSIIIHEVENGDH